LKNFSNLIINPVKKSQDFHLLSDSHGVSFPRSFAGSHKTSTGTSLKLSPKSTLISPKTPKVSLRKIINSSSTKAISPRKKPKILSQVPRSSLLIKKTPKVLKSSKTEQEKFRVEKVTFKTRTGMINGKSKSNNQDDYFVINNFAGCKNQLLAGVMDGHGIYGHDVSSFLKKQLPICIENNLPYDGIS
jgi:hypothetical protein